MYLKAAALICVLLRSVSSIASPLDKRQGNPDEIVYLANCKPAHGEYYKSYAAYYVEYRNSWNWQSPNSVSREYRDWSQGGSALTWEGKTQVLHFDDSGIDFTTNIQAGDRNSWAVGQVVGSGSNGFKTFTCRKDDDENRTLWWHSSSTENYYCNSIYYCQ